jgi:hypothetical protein
MTKEQLTREIIDGNKKMTTAMVGIKNALEKINDTNVLHSQILDNNTAALNILCAKNKSADGLIKAIILLLLIAVIVLAGVKQAGELFPNIFGFIK